MMDLRHNRDGPGFTTHLVSSTFLSCQEQIDPPKYLGAGTGCKLQLQKSIWSGYIFGRKKGKYSQKYLRNF